jgi:membrane fusion protein (multidrug efflux system)
MTTALTALLLLGALAGCKNSAAVDEPRTTRQKVAVLTIEPVLNFPDTIRLPGITGPNRVVNVAAEVAGRVEEVPVEEGDAVSCSDAGCTTIVRLNTDLLQAAYDRYASESAFQQRDYERLLEARRRGVATQMEVDQARMKAESFKALMDSAAAQLQRCVIVAPIDGLVNELPVEEGEYPQPGAPVAQIVDLSWIKVVVEVPERDVGYLSVGDVATIVIDDPDRERTVEGEITYISQLADPSTFTSRVEISVPNDQRQLRTGKIVEVRLTRRVIPEVILVPLSATIPRETDYIAYVVEDGKARRRPIRRGLIRGRDVQIVSGLSAGDNVIVDGQWYVADGQEVDVEDSVEEKLQAEGVPESPTFGDPSALDPSVAPAETAEDTP